MTRISRRKNAAKRRLVDWVRRQLEVDDGPNHQSDVEVNRVPATSDPLTAIGPNTYGAPFVIRYPGDRARITIASYCSLADDVEFLVGGNHNTSWVSSFPLRWWFGLKGAFDDGHPSSKGDIAVGNDVWIGRGAKVLSGVRIGDGAVVAGWSVVTRDVPPYAVVAGSPATVRKLRFTTEQIGALLRIKWWGWPEADIKRHVGELNGGAIDDFVKRFDPGRSVGASHETARI